MTVLDYLTSIGLSEQRARDHLRSSFVRVAGDIVTDPGTEVGERPKVLLQPPPVTDET